MNKTLTKQELIDELDALLKKDTKALSLSSRVQLVMNLAKTRLSEAVPYSSPDDFFVTIDLKKSSVADLSARSADQKQQDILAKLGFSRAAYGAQVESDVRVEGRSSLWSFLELAELGLGPFGDEVVVPGSVSVQIVNEFGVITPHPSSQIVVSYTTTERHEKDLLNDNTSTGSAEQ